MSFGVWFAWIILTPQVLEAVIIWFWKFNEEKYIKVWFYTYYKCFSMEGDRKEPSRFKEEAVHVDVLCNKNNFVKEGLRNKGI